MSKCQFCNGEFASKSVLNKHQKTAKFCLEIQGRTNTDFACQYCSQVLTSKQNQQNHELKCTKKTTVEFVAELDTLRSEITHRDQKITKLTTELKAKKEEYSTHMDDIKEMYENESREAEAAYATQLQERDQEIARLKAVVAKQKKSHEKQLQDLEVKLDAKHEKVRSELYQNILGLQATISRLAEIGAQKVSTVKNTIKNTKTKNVLTFNQKCQEFMEPLILSPSTVKKGMLKFTEKDVEDFPQSTAETIVKNFLTDSQGRPKYVCIDMNKKIFQYKDDQGELQTDTECKTLFEKISPSLFPYIGRIYQKKMEQADLNGDVFGGVYWQKTAENFTVTKAKKDLTKEISRKVPNKKQVNAHRAVLDQAS